MKSRYVTNKPQQLTINIITKPKTILENETEQKRICFSFPQECPHRLMPEYPKIKFNHRNNKNTENALTIRQIMKKHHSLLLREFSDSDGNYRGRLELVGFLEK